MKAQTLDTEIEALAHEIEAEEDCTFKQAIERARVLLLDLVHEAGMWDRAAMQQQAAA